MQESKQSVPSPMTGGGINTGETEQHGVVTQVLGIDNEVGPIREEELRARFLSFEPIFNADSRLVAHELMLKGRLTSEEQNSKAHSNDRSIKNNRFTHATHRRRSSDSGIVVET